MRLGQPWRPYHPKGTPSYLWTVNQVSGASGDLKTSSLGKTSWPFEILSKLMIPQGAIWVIMLHSPLFEWGTPSKIYHSDSNITQHIHVSKHHRIQYKYYYYLSINIKTTRYTRFQKQESKGMLKFLLGHPPIFCKPYLIRDFLLKWHLYTANIQLKDKEPLFLSNSPIKIIHFITRTVNIF